MRKAEHERDTNPLSIFEPMQKGAFEHGMNTKEKEENMFLTQQTEKWFEPSQ